MYTCGGSLEDVYGIHNKKSIKFFIHKSGEYFSMTSLKIYDKLMKGYLKNNHILKYLLEYEL